MRRFNGHAEPYGLLVLDLRMREWHEPCVVRVVRNVAHLSSLVELRPGVELVVPNLALRDRRADERDLELGDRIAA